ncbi:MAG: HAMP domain-containing sensor histidine kinase [Planctomycetaceae bacterium]
MQAGSMTFDRSTTDIERLIDEVVEKVRPQIEQKRQQFNVETPAKLPKLHVDKGKFVAAAGESAGQRVEVHAARRDITLHIEVSTHRIEFAVADSGFGIAASELPLVFDRFFRSNDDRVQSESGSGLGLTFTHEVARLHGGDLTVERVESGTTFRLQLPLESTGAGHD